MAALGFRRTAAALLLLTCLCSPGSVTATGFLADRICARPAKVQVAVSATIARVSEGFLCATLDWWPGDKCDYGSCSWKRASINNLDLASPMLERTLQALSPLTLRLGGSLQDRLIYSVGSYKGPCRDFVKQKGAIFGYSIGCLNMSRWQRLNKLFQRTRTGVIFGINALNGRTRVSKGVYSGAWDPSNARDFIQYTFDNEFEVQAWELGNELSANGVGATINSRQYAADAKALRRIVEQIYAKSPTKPLVVAPDGFFVASWYQDLLRSTGPQILDAITRHIYNLGPGVDGHLIQKILNPAYLSREGAAFKQMRDILSRYGPWAEAWIGEAGGAYNSGQHLVTDAFVSSFWYLDQLGMAASYNTALYCRQSLVGGNYALLQTGTFHPNPDYYSALLWKRVMGRDVLSALVTNETYLRAYAHCSRAHPGGVSVLLINLSNSTFYNVDIDLMVASPRASSSPEEEQQRPVEKLSTVGTRLEYHLSSPGTNLHSQSMLLNGELLQVSKDGQLPRTQPLTAVDPSMPIRLAPLTIAFAVMPDASAPACVLAS